MLAPSGGAPGLARLAGGALLAGLLACAAAQGAWGQAAAPALPDPLQADLQQAQVAPANTAWFVQPLDEGPLRLAWNEQQAMNPASTMKLLTTYTALATLGPDYRWRTAVYARGPRKGARLDGDLVVHGDGDPSLVIERWWLLVQHLRGLGIQEIRGDLVLDRTRYAAPEESPGLIDRNELRPYNVAPDALLINYRAIRFEFTPDAAAGVAHIVVTPPLDGIALPAHVPLAGGACGDWKARLRADFTDGRAPRFRGSYPTSCGTQAWHVSPLAADAYALASFRALWRQAGGRLRGTVRSGRVAAGDIHLFDQESPPLAEVIRDINKNSNNVMARQVFLTLGSPNGGGEDAPAEAQSAGRSITFVRGWLEQEGLAMPQLVLENGSGLSREERVSAAGLGRLLTHAWHGPDMPSFLASLPLAGVDGTMKKRHGAAHAAYVKTGYLSEVRALAGYVFAASGHRYVVVGLVNDPHAEAAQDALDDFLQWVWQRG